MAVLVGYFLYILASLLLGGRLVLLWRRTREWPELSIGLAFLLGGALGHVMWLAIGVAGMGEADPATIKQLATTGLFITVLGASSIGVGTAQIFRPGATWARAFVACVTVGMLVGFVSYLRAPAVGASLSFWWTLVVSSLLYGWSAAEAISVGRTLERRARLGMADPLVVSRMKMWGCSNAMTVLTIAVNFGARLAYGMAAPPWTALLGSAALMVGAVAIWLGFFPPRAYRARVMRAMETA